ncbi:hypothetical protein V6N13_091204 [Hibiscus sabdariffa]|uniref:Uncharacterized protein n=1 Tax=Hibiscus sabdariffa TaxID=183260 RepID=A0ABR2R343_9ROSI
MSPTMTPISILPLSLLLVITAAEALSMKLPFKWFVDPGVMDSRRFLVAVEIVPVTVVVMVQNIVGFQIRCIVVITVADQMFVKVGAGFHGITSVLSASDACCISHFLKEMYRGQRAASKNWNFWPM